MQDYQILTRSVYGKTSFNSIKYLEYVLESPYYPRKQGL